jgi:glycosyltransferase involved in cell wall biosynthesis
MGKKKSSASKTLLPFVSVCTPTYNRRPFFPITFQCFRNQTYPKNRIEWIIVDDGTDKVRDLIDESNISQIKYFAIDKKMNLGQKRNFMHKKCSGSIIVYMDDDDYYPPERIEHAVERLQSDKNILCAGSTEMYVFFKHIQKMYQCGPYGPNHATAGTFAFKKELLQKTKYNDGASLAEEKEFLQNYTIPLVQLDPFKTILVFSHEHNTFDKRKLLDNPHPDFFKESAKTVDLFIRKESEKEIKQFFLKDIDDLLKLYEPGEPKMKPDVIAQMKILEAEYAELRKKEEERVRQAQNQGPIMLQRPGEQPVALSNEQVVQMIQQLSQEKQNVDVKLKEAENFLQFLQNQITEKNAEIYFLKTELAKTSDKTSDNTKNKILELKKEETISQSKIQPEKVVSIDF